MLPPEISILLLLIAADTTSKVRLYLNNCSSLISTEIIIGAYPSTCI